METLESPFTKIFKRDGSTASFDMDRIVEAIFSAAQAVGGKDRSTALQLGQQVMDRLQTRFPPGKVPTVEEIQDIIEKTLIEGGHAKTAKAFIIYRQKRKEVRETHSSFLAIEKTVDQYIEGMTTTPLQATFPGLVQHVSDRVLKHYALNKVYSPQVSEAHRDKLIFIHDLESAIAGNAIELDLITATPLYLRTILEIRREWANRIILRNPVSTQNLTPYLFPDHKKQVYIFQETPSAAPEEEKSFGFITGAQNISHNISRAKIILSPKDKSLILGIIPTQQTLDIPQTNVGTVSLNLKKMAEGAASQKDFFHTLEHVLILSKQALLIKKKVFEQNFNQGMFPHTQAVSNFKTRGFLSIGLCGIFQASENLCYEERPVHKILSRAKEILAFTQKTLKTFSEETLQPFSLDFISATSCPFYEKAPEKLTQSILSHPELSPWTPVYENIFKVVSPTLKNEAFLAWLLPEYS
ncbi:MAG: hypothetical protein HYS08_10525 [Chlamydiae bacterium]|nr:hypothetical protein [Chlamydiota bacterium]MBI3265959.1 hypothetical protein [Chlamydiota bacterium]